MRRQSLHHSSRPILILTNLTVVLPTWRGESNAVNNIRPTDLNKLEGYRLSLDQYRQILKILHHFPKGEADFKNQMRRAARSVLMNISEGAGKRSRGRIAAYEVALGEAKELRAALDIVEIEKNSPTR